MKKIVIAAAAITAFVATPAFADYYVVKEGTSCKVVDKKPTDTKIVVMANGKVFKTKEEADKELKVVCK